MNGYGLYVQCIYSVISYGLAMVSISGYGLYLCVHYGLYHNKKKKKFKYHNPPQKNTTIPRETPKKTMITRETQKTIITNDLLKKTPKKTKQNEKKQR